MKFLFFLVASFALAGGVPSRPVNVVPKGVDLVSFPLLKEGELTASVAAQMGLTRDRLDEEVVVYSHNRFDNSWMVQALSENDLVYKDEIGGIRYRASGDRVEEIKQCIQCPPIVGCTQREPVVVPPPPEKSSWGHFRDNFVAGWRVTVNGLIGLAGLVGVFLPIAFLVVLGYLVVLFVRKRMVKKG